MAGVAEAREVGAESYAEEPKVQVHPDEVLGNDSEVSLSPRSSSEGAAGPSRGRPSAALDPDFEIPAGILTETDVFNQKQLRTDRYGFVAQRDGQPGSSSAASTSYGTTPQALEKHKRRVTKWRRMMGPAGDGLDQYVLRKPAKFKRRVRKGIPEEFRGMAWHLLSGGRALQEASPGVFAALQQQVDVAVDSAIMRDLNRTFPYHITFMCRQGPGQRALYNVLRAYAAYDRKVGYVQGMGFLSAVLLLHMGDEEAFWTLVAIMHGPAGPASASALASESGSGAGQSQQGRSQPQLQDQGQAAAAGTSAGAGAAGGSGSSDSSSSSSRNAQAGAGREGPGARGPGPPPPAAHSWDSTSTAARAGVISSGGGASGTGSGGGAGAALGPGIGGLSHTGHPTSSSGGGAAGAGSGGGAAAAGIVKQPSGSSGIGRFQALPSSFASPTSATTTTTNTSPPATPSTAVTGTAHSLAAWSITGGPGLMRMSSAQRLGAALTATGLRPKVPGPLQTGACGTAAGSDAGGPSTGREGPSGGGGGGGASTHSGTEGGAGPGAGAGLRGGLGEMYTSGMPLLQRCLFQLQGLLEDETPKLAALFKQEGMEVAMFSTHWFNTLFAYCLPFPHLLRLWDIFMLEGMKIIFRAALAVLKGAERRLLACNSLEKLSEALAARSIAALLPPPGKLVRDALSIKVTRRLAALQQQWEIKEAQARAEQLRRQQQRQQQQQARLKANA